MPPKARANVLRGAGRPQRAAASAPAPVVTPAKRGRPAKADAVEVAAEPPKKRGRPAKAEKPAAAVEEDAPKKRGRGRPSLAAAPEPVIEEAVPKKRGGRARKVQALVEEAPASKKRLGRPCKKAAVAEDDAPATPERGRHAKAAVFNPNGVAGSAHVVKRSSARTKATNTVASLPRLDTRVQPKLRTRLPPIPKAIKPAKRGRPAKAAVKAPAPKKTAGRKAFKAVFTKATEPAKPVAPRKIRGHTVRQIPDKFLADVDQFLQDLLEAQSPHDAPTEEEEETQEGTNIVAEDMQFTSETVCGNDQDGDLVSSEQDRDQYQDEEEHNDDAAAQVDMQEEEGLQATAVQGKDYEDELPEETLELVEGVEVERCVADMGYGGCA
ncbi:hypothetical protein EJ02DRAFT_454345 [Clathrospora elynae]|uniref:Uncharacterized protein n=1 Tax=Clathrospora elynae TaxID=706981 RepID=A0A6A5SNX5_9PLEO|nr:hypothetical protein EJ02DRAFT_454345 [Clathrospora elynae]